MFLHNSDGSQEFDFVAFETQLIDGELARYKQERPLLDIDADGNPGDPLAWWKAHEALYPHISSLAKKLLSIPATSAASERLFSAAGLTIRAHRASLLPEMAEMLVFCKANWNVVATWN